MTIYLNDMVNVGLIMVGRVVQTEFESSDAIEAAAAAVEELAEKCGVPLCFVYAGTTVNWPDMFEYTPCLVGVVTHEDYASEAGGANPLPRSALAPRSIPDEVWRALAEHGLKLASETGTYLTVAGWTCTRINGADGEPVVGVAAEDDGYLRIDDESRVMQGHEPLTMRTSYC